MDESRRAISDLLLIRFQVTQSNVGDAGVQTVGFVYVFKNAGSTTVRVLPLVPMKRDFHSNMSVMDAADSAIIILDSKHSREVSRSIALQLRRIVVENVNAAAKTPPATPIISTAAIEQAFQTETHTDGDYATRHAQILEGVQHAEGETSGVIKQLNVVLQNHPEMYIEPDRLLRVKEALEAAKKLHALLLLRRANYRPLVLADCPVAPGLYGLVKQTLTSPAGAVNTANGLRSPWHHAVELLTGRTFATLFFPLVKDLQSYHLHILPAPGLQVAGEATPENFPSEPFRSHHQGTRYYTQSHRGIDIYRTRAHIETYENQIPATPDREMVIRVPLRELPAITMLFLSALVLAVAYGLSVGQLDLLSLVVVVALAMVAQSLDKPFSQRVLPGRLLAVLAAWAVGEGLARLPGLLVELIRFALRTVEAKNNVGASLGGP